MKRAKTPTFLLELPLRFVLDPGVGDGGFLIWNEQVIPAIIDWRDPVVQHGLRHPIKYVRLVRRRASSAHAQGADGDGNRYFVQLVLEGHAFIKPKHRKGKTDIIGLDIGPSTLVIVPRQGQGADLVTFCEELAPATRKKRRLQRKMERQRRANNPENYDERGRIKKHGSARLRWYESKRYQAIRRQHANTERRLAAHRKSLHGKLAHRIALMGNIIQIEQDLVQRMAKAVWSKRWTSSTRDVSSAFETPSCENWRHPGRASLPTKPN